MIQKTREPHRRLNKEGEISPQVVARMPAQVRRQEYAASLGLHAGNLTSLFGVGLCEVLGLKFNLLEGVNGLGLERRHAGGMHMLVDS